MRNLLANTPGLAAEHLAATKQLMDIALPDATVVGYETHIKSFELPDPDDRHVAAIKAGASIIVIWNLRDFPVGELRRHGLTRQSPDAFLSDLHDQAPDMLVDSLVKARRNHSQSAMSAETFLNMLRDQKLTQLHKRLRNHVSAL